MKTFLVKFPALVLTLLVCVIGSSSAYGAATIVIQNADQPGVGFNDQTPATPIGGNSGTTIGQQRLNAFQHAANIWGAALPNGPTIVINARWAALPCSTNSGTLGAAGATSIRANFPNAPFANTWYTVAQANALAGNDLNGATAEINAQFNVNLGTPGCLQNTSWYYGLDTNHGNRINLVTVLLHEFGHGLGFSSFTDEETGAQIQGIPGIYERFLFDITANKTWVQMTNAERVSSAINTNNLVWNGPQVVSDAPTVLTGGRDSLGRPRLFAPNPVDVGSSVSHWDISTSPNQLMEPNISSNLMHSVSVPRDLTFSLLRDIGWCTNCPAPPPPPPAPANDNFANALTVSGCSFTIGGTTISATKESGEPSHNPDPTEHPGSASVWYQWQAPSNSSVTITTDDPGTNYDTMLGVYSGNNLSTLQVLGKNDDIVLGQNTNSRVTFNAVAGQVYKIAVDGYGGAMGSFVLRMTATGCTTATNPIDNAQFFVDRHYQDFLGRTPDAGGLQYWSEQITGNSSTNAPPPCPPGDRICENIRRISVSAAFFVENEFQRTGGFVYRFYKASHGTRPTYQQFNSDRALVPENAQLEQSKQAFANQWVQRPEFLQRYPASLSGPAFVDALLLNVLLSSGVDLSAQRTNLINDFNAGGRARVVRNVADNATFAQAEYNKAFVVMQYFGYLQRDPDEGGYQFWLNVLDNQVPNNFRAMVCAFLTSAEYQQRFGSTITRSNSDCAQVGP